MAECGTYCQNGVTVLKTDTTHASGCVWYVSALPNTLKNVSKPESEAMFKDFLLKD
jgi:hypothetical protein